MTRADLEALDKSALVELALLQSQQIDALAARLDALERRVVRGAAPFARPEDKRKASPKRPGRKGGHKGMFRKPPPDEAVDERLEAPLNHLIRNALDHGLETPEDRRSAGKSPRSRRSP